MNKLYILCIWIWTASIIIFFIPKLPSLLYLSVFALVFDLFYANIYLNLHISKIVGLFTIETFIVLINLYKHVKYKIAFLSKNVLFFNMLFLSIYLTYLNINKNNIYNVYLNQLKNRHNNENETFIEYIKSDYFLF